MARSTQLSSESVKSSAEPSSNVKRYNLVLPESLYLSLQATAERRHTTVLELLKKFIRLGLVVESLDDGSALILREGQREREIMLF